MFSQRACSSAVCSPALFFPLVLIGSKPLSNISALCSVRGFACWMQDPPCFSLPLFFPLPLIRHWLIISSQFLAVLGGFKLPHSGPWVWLHSSHTALDLFLIPHLAVTQRTCSQALAVGGRLWHSGAGHGLQQNTTPLSSPGSFTTPILAQEISLREILSHTLVPKWLFSPCVQQADPHTELRYLLYSQLCTERDAGCKSTKPAQQLSKLVTIYKQRHSCSLATSHRVFLLTHILSSTY